MTICHWWKSTWFAHFSHKHLITCTTWGAMLLRTQATPNRFYPWSVCSVGISVGVGVEWALEFTGVVVRETKGGLLKTGQKDLPPNSFHIDYAFHSAQTPLAFKIKRSYYTKESTKHRLRHLKKMPVLNFADKIVQSRNHAIHVWYIIIVFSYQYFSQVTKCFVFLHLNNFYKDKAIYKKKRY